MPRFGLQILWGGSTKPPRVISQSALGSFPIIDVLLSLFCIYFLDGRSRGSSRSVAGVEVGEMYVTDCFADWKFVLF